MPEQRKSYLYDFLPVRLFTFKASYKITILHPGFKNLWLKKEASVTAEMDKPVILSFPEFLLDSTFKNIFYSNHPIPSHTHKKEETAWTE